MKIMFEQYQYSSGLQWAALEIQNIPHNQLEVCVSEEDPTSSGLMKDWISIKRSVKSRRCREVCVCVVCGVCVRVCVWD